MFTNMKIISHISMRKGEKINALQNIDRTNLVFVSIFSLLFEGLYKLYQIFYKFLNYSIKSQKLY